VTRYTKTDVSTGGIVGSDINVQLGLIETAIADGLDKTGTTPNTMSADIDLNSNDLLNATSVNSIIVNSPTVNASTIDTVTLVLGGISITIDDLLNGVIVPGDGLDWTIDQGATNIHSGNYTDTVYSHPTGDSNLHVPANSTTNNGKVLTSGATAGSYTWESPVTGTTDHTLLSNIGTNTHVQLDTHVALVNAHLDWTAAVGTVHSSNYTNTTYTSSDFTHDSLTGVSANEHLDWTASVGTIHTGNYTNTTYVSSDFTHDNLTGVAANEHLDWTSASVGTISSTNLATVLNNTTASFLTADETKLDYITVTQAVDLDAIEGWGDHDTLYLPIGGGTLTSDLIVQGTADSLIAINAQTGTTYTTVIGDSSTLITMDNAAANTLTIPPNSSVAYSVGTVMQINQKGAGATTVAEGAGVTINKEVGLVLNAQHAAASIVKLATDTWLLTGSLKA